MSLVNYQTHPAFIDMIEDAIFRLGDNATGQQIREYIESHYDLKEDHHQIELHLKRGLGHAVEMEEIERTGGSGDNCRFRLSKTAAEKQKALSVLREGVKGPWFGEQQATGQ